MHRRPLLTLLDAYAARRPDEATVIRRIRSLVVSRPDCFERSCLPGHVTASCWVASPARDRVLLTHHRKLGRWLQLGGHADGDPEVARVALREAREESGMHDFDAVVPHPGCPLVDVDVHRIPARPGEPAHEHHDLRFVFVARPGQLPSISSE